MLDGIDLTKFTWFDSRAALTKAADDLAKSVAECDFAIAQSELFVGSCPVCLLPTVFSVNTGAMFDNRPNLREGLRCHRCRLTARQRLTFVAIEAEIGTSGCPKGAVLEESTRLFKAIRSRWPSLIGSEYLGADRVSGRSYWWATHWWRWRRSRHESITELSYATNSLDIIVHSDVLEHVYDTELSIRECARVLRKGGIMLFTAPFFISLSTSILRGRPVPGGRIEHLEPPEYHGDGISSKGIYTFHSFGWDLLGMLRKNGFSSAEIGLCYSPTEGFTSSDPPTLHPWSMLPILFRAVK